MACSCVPQTDGGNGDSDSGILLTAQTITSETTSSTTTTQITKVTPGRTTKYQFKQSDGEMGRDE